jgi:hypothetical protein
LILANNVLAGTSNNIDRLTTIVSGKKKGATTQIAAKIKAAKRIFFTCFIQKNISDSQFL